MSVKVSVAGPGSRHTHVTALAWLGAADVARRGQTGTGTKAIRGPACCLPAAVNGLGGCADQPSSSRPRCQPGQPPPPLDNINSTSPHGNLASGQTASHVLSYCNLLYFKPALPTDQVQPSLAASTFGSRRVSCASAVSAELFVRPPPFRLVVKVIARPSRMRRCGYQ